MRKEREGGCPTSAELLLSLLTTPDRPCVCAGSQGGMEEGDKRSRLVAVPVVLLAYMQQCIHATITYNAQCT